MVPLVVRTPAAATGKSDAAGPAAPLRGCSRVGVRRALLAVCTLLAAIGTVGGILYGVALGAKDARVAHNNDLVSVASGAPVHVLATAKSVNTAGFTAAADDSTFYRELTSATLAYETGSTITFATSGSTRVDDSSVLLHTLVSAFPLIAVDGAAARPVAVADADTILQAIRTLTTQSTGSARALVAALPARRLQSATISGTTPACSAGTYESTPSSCSPCGANSYSNSSGATSCTPCSAGYATWFSVSSAGPRLTGQSSCFEVRRRLRWA